VNILEKLPIPLSTIGLGILGLALIFGGIFLITRRIKDSPRRVKVRAAPLPKAAKPAAAQQPAVPQNPQPPLPKAAKLPLPSSQAATAQEAARPPVPPRAAKPQTPLDPVRRSVSYEDQYKGPPVPDDGRPLMLRLFVEDQNTFIGKRNIHQVKQGFTFTIGGGKSDFLIFLVPLPPRIAELRYEDKHCILIPRKGRYFPDIGSEPVRDCIGKTIRIISDKNYEIHMRLDWYEDPLIKLNTLLRSISVPK
jgi:hypothetical protein